MRYNARSQREIAAEIAALEALKDRAKRHAGLDTAIAVIAGRLSVDAAVWTLDTIEADAVQDAAGWLAGKTAVPPSAGWS